MLYFKIAYSLHPSILDHCATKKGNLILCINKHSWFKLYLIKREGLISNLYNDTQKVMKLKDMDITKKVANGIYA